MLCIASIVRSYRLPIRPIPYSLQLSKSMKRAKTVGSSKPSAELKTPAEDSDSHRLKRRKSEKGEVSKKEDNDAEDATPAEKPAHMRDLVEPWPLSEQFKYLKILNWNVNGLNAVITTKKDILFNLIEKHQPDFICLQETKLQEIMIENYKLLFPDYYSYFSCSTVKKGYSGTALLVKKKIAKLSSSFEEPKANNSISKVETPLKSKKQMKLSNFFQASTTSTTTNTTSTTSISMESTTELTISKTIENESKVETVSPAVSLSTAEIELLGITHDFEIDGHSYNGEGRVITLETNLFYLVVCYVPNSGEGLKRLEYRIQDWYAVHYTLYTLYYIHYSF
jgi:exonuclease III